MTERADNAARPASRLRRWGGAVLGGVLYGCSFVFGGWQALILPAVALFWAAAAGASRRCAALAGFCFGLAAFLTGMYWLAWVTVLGYALYAPFGALFFALLAVLVCAADPSPARAPLRATLLLAASWASMELVRGHVGFLSLPWLFAGHALANWPQAAQLTALTGVAGVTFLVVCTGAALLPLWRWLRGLGGEARFPAALWLAVCAAWVANLTLGARRIARLGLSPGPLVGVVQPCALDKDELTEAEGRRMWEDCAALHRWLLARSPERPEFVVWPETALPEIYTSSDRYRRAVGELVRESGVALLFGSEAVVGERHSSVWDQEWTNSAFLLDAGGQIIGQYDKIRPVPFGEYIPLSDRFPWLKKLGSLTNDTYVPGRRGQLPLRLGRYRLGVNICYEDVFPEGARQAVRAGADLLINLTNDAMFGRSAEARQHFELAKFRALETGRSLLRVTNSGISGVIDPAGREAAVMGEGTERILLRGAALWHVPIRRERSSVTLYVRWGEWFSLLCAVLVLGRWVWRGRAAS